MISAIENTYYEVIIDAKSIKYDKYDCKQIMCDSKDACVEFIRIIIDEIRERKDCAEYTDVWFPQGVVSNNCFTYIELRTPIVDKKFKCAISFRVQPIRVVDVEKID